MIQLAQSDASHDAVLEVITIVETDVDEGLLLTTQVKIAESPKDEEHAHGGAPGGMSGMNGMDMWEAETLSIFRCSRVSR